MNTMQTGAVPDAVIPWYCKNPSCASQEARNARSKRVECPRCGGEMAPSIWALSRSHPLRAPYEDPKSHHRTLTGTVVHVEKVRGKSWWRMTLEMNGAHVTGTLPTAVRPSNPYKLVGQRVTLEADVAWFEPTSGWYRAPKNARKVNDASSRQ